MRSLADRSSRGRGRAATAFGSLLALAAVVLLAVTLASPEGAQRTSAPADLQGAPERDDVLYVAQDGCDDTRTPKQARDPATPWCSLARAVEAAPAHAEIRVGPGSYPWLELDGRTRRVKPVAFRARSGEERPVLHGMELTRVRGLSFSGFLFDRGASIVDSGRMRLAHNGFVSGGIYVKSSRRVAIVSNHVRGLRGIRRGLTAQGSTDPDEPGNEDLLVRGNTFEDIEHDAIAVYNSHRRVRLVDNRISNVHAPEGFPYHTDAMQLMGGDDVTVSGNVISDVSQGILVKDGVTSTDLEISGNLVTGTDGAGLQIFNAPGARVARNTVWDTRFGTILSNVASIAGRTTVDLRDNVIDRLTVQAAAHVGRADGNVFGTGKPIGDADRIGRPRFFDAAAGDFRIRGTRPPGAQLRIDR